MPSSPFHPSLWIQLIQVQDQPPREALESLSVCLPQIYEIWNTVTPSDEYMYKEGQIDLFRGVSYLCIVAEPSYVKYRECFLPGPRADG